MTKYRITYTIYEMDYRTPPKQQTVVVSEDPWVYINRLKADLTMVDGTKTLGTYVIEPINHLKVVK